ncbi:MAG TPA: radical SAM protein [Nannocystaceae bacterium]|nr:radical SAM protein [Nannocystaceae bacterium]
MGLTDVRKRLPVVDALPVPDDRRIKATTPGQLPTPRYAVWELTLACDQKCVHCGSRAGHARAGELTTDECLDVVAQLRELGIGEVTLVGGEAYLRDDFILVVRALREHGMRASMTTGGRNLTQARADALKDAGLTNASVSIDGLEPEHDRLRGVAGSWRAAFAAIERLRRAGIPTAVNTQINALTKASLPALFEHIAAAGAFGWQLQITAPFGNAADHPDILLQPYDLLELFEMLAVLVPRVRARGVKLWPANNLGYFGPLESDMRVYQKRGAHYKGCGAGKFQIGLESDGTVKGCPSLGGPQNHAGNVRTARLADLWRESFALSYIRERTEDDLWGFCASCYYREPCRAGCTATAEPLMGRPGNNPFCHHRALEMDRQGLRERIEPVAPAPGLPFDHGYYRIVREPKDPQERARTGPVSVDEPRIPRTLDPFGPGRPLAVGERDRQ